MSDRFGLEGNFLIHSAKGTSWGKHKYIRKIGDRYIYKETLSKDDLKGLTDDVMSGKLGTGDTLKKNLGNYYSQVMSSVNGKFKKPGSGKKVTSNKEKTGKSSGGSSKSKSENDSTKEKTEKTENVKKNTSVSNERPKTYADVIKNSLKSAVKFTDKDSIYATKNEDGTTTVTVDYEDGTTQTFKLNKELDVVSKSEKTKKNNKGEA